jgi:hypothetical protein
MLGKKGIEDYLQYDMGLPKVNPNQLTINKGQNAPYSPNQTLEGITFEIPTKNGTIGTVKLIKDYSLYKLSENKFVLVADGSTVYETTSRYGDEAKKSVINGSDLKNFSIHINNRNVKHIFNERITPVDLAGKIRNITINSEKTMRKALLLYSYGPTGKYYPRTDSISGKSNTKTNISATELDIYTLKGKFVTKLYLDSKGSVIENQGLPFVENATYLIYKSTPEGMSSDKPNGNPIGAVHKGMPTEGTIEGLKYCPEGYMAIPSDKSKPNIYNGCT